MRSSVWLAALLVAGCTEASFDLGTADPDIGADEGTGDVSAEGGDAVTDTGHADTGAGDSSAVDTGTDSGTPVDTGPKDTGLLDTGLLDTGPLDTGVPDTGKLDTGLSDTGVADTGVVDSTVTDTGVSDTGTADSGAADTGVADSTVTDSGVTDTGTADTGTADTGVTDTGVADTGVADSTVTDSGASDTGVVDGTTDTSFCSPVSDTSTDIFVNAGAAPGGNGSYACPLKSVVAAANLPLGAVSRTIHVKAATYTETDSVRLKNGVTLIGEGGVVTIKAASVAACLSGGEKCAVVMEMGSTIDSVTIDASTTTMGIVGPPSTGGSAASIKIKNTTVTGALQDGGVLLAGGTVTASHFDGNNHSGLVAKGGRVIVNTSSSFSANLGKADATAPSVGGLVIAGGATLDFQSGEAGGNSAHGVVFDAALGSTITSDVINNLLAKGNTGIGLAVFTPNRTYLTVRSSTFVNNQIGIFLQFNMTFSNIYDLGTYSSSGNNKFSADASTKTLLLLCGSGYAGSTAAIDNTWPTCAPKQYAQSSCDPPASYQDITYKSATATTNPVDTSNCKAG